MTSLVGISVAFSIIHSKAMDETWMLDYSHDFVALSYLKYSFCVLLHSVD